MIFFSLSENYIPHILTLLIPNIIIHNFTFRMQLQYPSWSDEDIFQSARRLNIATLQNIIAYEYLPAFLDVELSPYTGYKPFTHPGISHEFQSAAFR